MYLSLSSAGQDFLSFQWDALLLEAGFLAIFLGRARIVAWLFRWLAFRLFFLSGAVKDSINSIRQGEQAATSQVQGKANLVDVVQSVNAAELTLDTVVAVRDKVVAAYQSILNMPI